MGRDCRQGAGSTAAPAGVAPSGVTSARYAPGTAGACVVRAQRPVLCTLVARSARLEGLALVLVPLAPPLFFQTPRQARLDF